MVSWTPQNRLYFIYVCTNTNKYNNEITPFRSSLTRALKIARNRVFSLIRNDEELSRVSTIPFLTLVLAHNDLFPSSPNSFYGPKHQKNSPKGHYASQTQQFKNASVDSTACARSSTMHQVLWLVRGTHFAISYTFYFK